MKVKNLIIGAGPAGLAIAGQLRHEGLSFEILEQSDKIAPKWHQHYDRLHLHTVKERSGLPNQDFPEHYPQYISKNQLIEYFDQYALKFEIKPHFNTSVKSIYKNEAGWKVECSNSKTFEAENVIIATGLNRIPKIPTWKGQESFKGEITHASQYKNPNSFKDKTVLVIGMGNTGAEIALDLAEASIFVGISVRSELVVVPRELFGKPVQQTGEKLARMPFGLGNLLSKLGPLIAFGNLKKYGLPISNISPTALRLIHGKTPTIDLGTIEKIKVGKISVCKEIAAFEEDGVSFVDGTSQRFNAVILATGYYAQLDSILGKNHSSIDESGEPKMKIAQDKGLYFIGYEKHTLGGILSTLKEDALLIVNDLLKPS
jgi:hypothetical protein